MEIDDALEFLDMANARFFNRPDKCNKLLDILERFRREEYVHFFRLNQSSCTGMLCLHASLECYSTRYYIRIGTLGLMRQIGQLFYYHPDLIEGFNEFCPLGYYIVILYTGEIAADTPRGRIILSKKTRAENSTQQLGRRTFNWSTVKESR